MTGPFGVFAMATMLSGAAVSHSVTYCDTLLTETLKRQPDLAAIRINAARADGQAVQCQAGKSTREATGAPLNNALAEHVGTVEITFKNGRKDTRKADSIAQRLSRRIYTVAGLQDADPLVPGARRSQLGQAIVDQAIDSDPKLVTLAMHVTLPDAANEIIASNFGRIGKAADDDDRHVILDGAMLKELTNGGSRLAIELPLHDRSGRTIGALSTSFALARTDDEDATMSHAFALRDSIAREIPSSSALLR